MLDFALGKLGGSVRASNLEQKTKCKGLIEEYMATESTQSDKKWFVFTRNDLVWSRRHPSLSVMMHTHSYGGNHLNIHPADVWIPYSHDFDGFNVRTSTIRGWPNA